MSSSGEAVAAAVDGAVADVLALVAARDPRAGTTKVVAVDGPSGSGKTTFAALVAGALDAPVVRMDDLYPGWDGLADAVPRMVEWVLEPLAAGRPAGFRRFDWDADAYAEWHEMAPHPVLVTEGVGSAATPCARFLTATVWVEAARPVRFARGIARDGEAYRPHWERWAAQEDAHFAVDGTRARADVRLATG